MQKIVRVRTVGEAAGSAVAVFDSDSRWQASAENPEMVGRNCSQECRCGSRQLLIRAEDVRDCEGTVGEVAGRSAAVFDSDLRWQASAEMVGCDALFVGSAK